MNIYLISYEGEEVVLSEKILMFSDFLSELPDPYQKVNLGSLYIDTETLLFIKAFFEKCDYNPTEYTQTLKPLYKNYEGVEDSEKIFELDLERLLLLAHGCHKLNIKCLQNIILARIASLVDFDSYEAASKEFCLDLSEDAHLDLYLKIENKWTGTIYS